jgi:hypothetical protein
VAVWGPGGASLSTLGALKRLRDSYKESELAVINVSFHESTEKAREVSASSDPGGPLVAIPNDTAVRRLWRDGSGIARLPECFLVDREGILRFVGASPFGLKNEVDILFGRATRPFAPTIHNRFPTAKAAPKVPAAPAKNSGPRAGGR